MQRDEIFDTLKKIVTEQFELKDAQVTASTTQSDLGIDSILMVNLMMDVEEAFDIKIKDIDLPKNPTMDDIVGLVEKNL